MDITAVINGHREQGLARPSLASLRAAVGYARSRGLEVEVVAALDCSDALTRDVFRDVAFDVPYRQLELDVDDLGEARNRAVAAARGRWIALLDADDLWSENWLHAAFAAASADARLAVWHPEVAVYFGEAERVLAHVDMDDPDYDLAALAVQNQWTALGFCSADLLRAVPYPTTNLSIGRGYEDWGWNMAVIAKGARHKVVPDTGHMIRVRSNSLGSRTARSRSHPAIPPGMFRTLVGAKDFGDPPPRKAAP